MEEYPSEGGISKVSMVYGVEDKLPLAATLVVSFQQGASMMVGVITPALILASILHFSDADKSYLVSMALLAAALVWMGRTKSSHK
jgi:xanthine permease XanP